MKPFGKYFILPSTVALLLLVLALRLRPSRSISESGDSVTAVQIGANTNFSVKGRSPDWPATHRSGAVSPWIVRLEKMDCKGFYIRNHTNEIPELQLLDHLFSQYNLSDNDRYLAVRRAYEGVSDSTRFCDLRENAVGSIDENYQRFLSTDRDQKAIEEMLSERARVIRSAQESFNETVDRKRRSTILELRELIPSLDDQVSNLLFAIRPRVLAAPEDLVARDP